MRKMISCLLAVVVFFLGTAMIVAMEVRGFLLGGAVLCAVSIVWLWEDLWSR